MPRQAATIGSMPQAFEVVKEMQADEPGRGLSPGRSPGAGRDRRGPGTSRAGWPRQRTAGETPSTPAPCATGAERPWASVCVHDGVDGALGDLPA